MDQKSTLDVYYQQAKEVINHWRPSSLSLLEQVEL